MDQGILKMEPEVVAVLEHIDQNHNFLLSGGAGSGKTYSLVQLITELLGNDLNANIACITYTNAAVHEIKSRISSERLSVSTIHDFLWSIISSYQREIKIVLLELIGGESPLINPGSLAIHPAMFDGEHITYKEYRLLDKGIISHDEIIVLSQRVFENYPKIRDILRDRFKYIFVDEYQDTDPAVVKILLDHMPKSSRKGICGFFGDAMQSIYDGSIGSIKNYVDQGVVFEIQKRQNRRNPRLVFELANTLRTDGLEQRESEDPNAPNMKDQKVKEGIIQLYYSLGNEDRLGEVRARLGWDFSETKQTKELNLTHNLIAPQAGFSDLMEIYDKDGVLNYRDRIVEYIKKNDDIANYDEKTFGEVLDLIKAGKSGKTLASVNPTAGMRAFIDAHPDLLTEARLQIFRSFRRMYVNKEQLADDKKQTEEDIERKGSQRCDFIRHVFKIQEVVHLYRQKKYGEFLRKTEFKIKVASDKLHLKELIEKIDSMGSHSIFDVIEIAHNNGLCIKDDKFRNFCECKPYLLKRLAAIKYSSYQNLFEYLEGRTTYSTQHKIKGQEFDRVLVVLDSGGWNNYNFNYLFEGNGTESVRERTQKLFYVCCTRAKEHLAVYFRMPTSSSVEQAKKLFGNSNVIEV